MTEGAGTTHLLSPCGCRWILSDEGKEIILDLPGSRDYFSREALFTQTIFDRYIPQLAAEYEEKRLVPAEYRDGKKVKGMRDWKNARTRLKMATANFGKKRIRNITYADIENFRNDLLTRLVVYRNKKGEITRSKERSIADVNHHDYDDEDDEKVYRETVYNENYYIEEEQEMITQSNLELELEELEDESIREMQEEWVLRPTLVNPRDNKHVDNLPVPESSSDELADLPF
jgi:hypothetical protein